MQTAFDPRRFLGPAGTHRDGRGPMTPPGPWVSPDPSGSGLRVVEVADRAAFLRLQEEWNALVEATSDAPFYRHEYLLSWMDGFVPRARLKVLTGRDRAGRLVAALPFVAERGLLYGVPVRWLVSPTSDHSARFDLIAADRRSAARAFLATLAADTSWDVIRIANVPEGGNAWDLYRAAAQAGFPAGAWESHRSPYIPLPASFDALVEKLPSKFKKNLRRSRRQLEESGAVTVEHVSGGGVLQASLEECFELERRGWKGRNGTAAAQSRRTHGFYTGLAHHAARGDYFSLSFLKVRGRTIASHYGLTRRGIYSLMLTCYDEAYRVYSPGQLLTEEVMRHCVAGGLSEFDFLGCDQGWKRIWSPAVRAHHWLFIFRNNTLGRTLHKTKFGWIPAAKEGLRRWRRPGD